MRANPWRWLWGVLPLTILTWLAILAERPGMEADLIARTQAALKAEGIDGIKVSFTGRDGILLTPADRGTLEKASQIAQGVWGVRTLRDSAAMAGTIENYPWQAETDGQLVRLSGYVPDEEQRGAILSLAQARFPDRQIEDHMRIGAGAPAREASMALIAFGFERLGELKTGNVELRHLDLAIAGEARSHAAYQNAQNALSRQRPAAAASISSKITPPVMDPYTWGAEKTASQLVLTGYVPDLDTREQLFDQAKTMFPKLAVIDRMAVAGGAGDGWLEAALAVLEALKNLNDGKAKASAGDILLRGQANDAATAEHISAALKSALPEAFKAQTDLTFTPPAPLIVTPFTTGIGVKSAVIEFSGFVPDDRARLAVLAHAARLFPDSRAVDHMALGAGAPEGWRLCVVSGLEALARLGNGQVRLSDRSLEVHGHTQDEALAEVLPAQVRTAVNRSCESHVEIALEAAPEPHLNWSATNTGNGELVLSGQVPDKATEDVLLSTASSLFPQVHIENRMTATSGPPGKWEKVAVTGLQALARLRRGQATITGQDLTVNGEAGDSSVATSVKDQLSHNLAKGYIGHAAIEVRSEAMIWADREAARQAAEAEAHRRAEEVARAAQERDRVADEEARKQAAAAESAESHQDADHASAQSEDEQAGPVQPERGERIAEADRCEQRMSEAAAAGTIRFEFGSADLDAESAPTLDRLAEIAKGCPTFRIEVRGHSDSIGSEERNQQISEARARVVADYLSRAGVDAARLHATGYGSTRPVVPNASATDRAMNRRIEFSVTVD